jgi:hypothetical protein
MATPRHRGKSRGNSRCTCGDMNRSQSADLRTPGLRHPGYHRPGAPPPDRLANTRPARGPRRRSLAGLRRPPHRSARERRRDPRPRRRPRRPRTTGPAPRPRRLRPPSPVLRPLRNQPPHQPNLPRRLQLPSHLLRPLPTHQPGRGTRTGKTRPIPRLAPGNSRNLHSAHLPSPLRPRKVLGRRGSHGRRPPTHIVARWAYNYIYQSAGYIKAVVEDC